MPKDSDMVVVHQDQRAYTKSSSKNEDRYSKNYLQDPGNR